MPKGRTVPIPSPDHQAVERRSLREIAADKIKAAIFDRTLEPGENLRDEDLQAWLGMSRTPVREALIELKRLGLVDMEAQRFTRVTSPEPNPTAALRDLQTVGALLSGVVRLTVPALGNAATSRILKAVDGMDDVLAERRQRRIREPCAPVRSAPRRQLPEPDAHRSHERRRRSKALQAVPLRNPAEQ